MYGRKAFESKGWEIKDLVPKMQVDRYVIHDIELVVDRLQVTADLKARLSQSVQHTMKLGKGFDVCGLPKYF